MLTKIYCVVYCIVCFHYWYIKNGCLGLGIRKKNHAAYCVVICEKKKNQEKRKIMPGQRARPLALRDKVHGMQRKFPKAFGANAYALHKKTRRHKRRRRRREQKGGFIGALLGGLIPSVLGELVGSIGGRKR